METKKDIAVAPADAMREIKFRAWNLMLNEMEPVTELGWTNGLVDFVRAGDDKGSIGIGSSEMEKNIVLMQFTNLKDKNGKEIYEGDIVTYGFIDSETDEAVNEKHVVEFWKAGFYPMSFFTDLKFEIIGNVWENPELMKQ